MVSISPAVQAQRKTPLTVSLNQQRYTLSDTMVVTVTNQARVEYGFNPCVSRAFQRQTGDQWLEVDEGPRLCELPLLILQPGQVWSGELELPRGVHSGNYRLLLRLGRQDPQPTRDQDEVRVASEPFTLAP